MKKEKLFYYGSVGIVALFVSVFLVVRVFSTNSIERNSGFESDYKSEESSSDLRETYQIKVKGELIRLKIFKNRRYEMYWYAGQEKMLYSKGDWTCEFYEPVGQTKYDEDRFVYQLNSDKIEPQHAQYRCQWVKLVGSFRDPANPKKFLSKNDNFEAPVSESFRLLIFDDFVMNLGNKNKYQLLKKREGGILYYDYRKTNILDRPVSPEQDSMGLVAIEFKKSSRIASVYTCDTCCQDYKTRFVLYKNRTYEMHLINAKEVLLYSKGNYKPNRYMELQSEELMKEKALYRFQNSPIHGEFHCGFDQLETIEAMDSSTCFVELFKVRGRGANLSGPKGIYRYEPDLSTMNVVRSGNY